jgi:hypothetical protein
LYILNGRPLSNIYFAMTFSQCLAYLLILFNNIFHRAVFNFDEVQLLSCLFYRCALDIVSKKLVRCWWLRPVILTTLEGEIGKIAVQDHLR